jgi:hypothetical protein
MVKQQPSPSSAARFPAWQREIDASLNETDTQKLLRCIYAAEAAIGSRLSELAQSPDKEPLYKAERLAIAQALETLRALKRDKLGFPDWNGKA